MALPGCISIIAGRPFVKNGKGIKKMHGNRKKDSGGNLSRLRPGSGSVSISGIRMCDFHVVCCKLELFRSVGD